MKHFSLYELNSMVRDVISMSLPDSYWVEAELSEAREGYGGHCYLDAFKIFSEEEFYNKFASAILQGVSSTMERDGPTS